MEPLTLHTPRLELSTPTPADAEAITVGAQDPEVVRWTTLPSPYRRADADAYIERARQMWAEASEAVWAIRAGGAWVGMIGLHKLLPGQSAEIGYWITAAARGRGLMGEAARAVVDAGFADPHLALQRIEWRAVVGNIPSARTARRLGFRYEGMLRGGLSGPRGRSDGWIAGLLHDDDRTPVAWPML